MKLRAATEADLPGIFEIYDHEVLHGTATFDTQPKTPAERLEWFRNDGGGRYPLLVATSDDPSPLPPGEGPGVRDRGQVPAATSLTPPPAPPAAPPSPGGRGAVGGGLRPPVNILGWARLYAWSPRKAYDRTAENAVYVHRDCRGRGISRALMQELMRLAPQRGVQVLIARIVEGNPASRALHKTLGFRSIGVMKRVGEKFGRILDVRLMDKHLGADR